MPDFIIAGAMKSGTTSLRRIMSAHPDVYMPRWEARFFSSDDPDQEPDYFYRGREFWSWRDLDTDWDWMVPWYAAHFVDHGNARVIGEASPVYLASESAPIQIARLLPNVRLLFLLRDPVSRAYSHYWHNVESGRAFFDFETTIRHCPQTILQRGKYREQLLRFLSSFPRNQIKIALFEDFVAAPIAVAREMLQFVGVDPRHLPDSVETHWNKARVPRSLPLRLWRNRLAIELIGRKYVGLLPNMPPERRAPSLWKRALASLLDRINPLSRIRPKAMAEDTRAYLRKYYNKANRGLGELIQLDVDRAWNDQC